MVREIKLFGALKKFGKDGVLAIEAPRGAKVSSLREIIKIKISESHGIAFKGEVLDRSAIAVESKLLGEEDSIPDDGSIVVLPPVCGG